MDPTWTPHRPHDPTLTLHRFHIDPHSTPISTQLRSKAISPPPHQHIFILPSPSPLPHFYCFSIWPVIYKIRRAKARPKGSNEGKKGQNKDQKGQNEHKRHEKDYRAKFRNTFSLVNVSLGNSLDCPATPIQLGQLVSPGLLLSKKRRSS